MTYPEPCRCVICHDYGDREARDAFDRQTIDHVIDHGWTVIMIPTDEAGPGWAFTIGLRHTHNSPELAMFGLDVHDMKEVLNVLGRQVATGTPVESDRELGNVIERLPVVLKNVDQRWHRAFFGAAIGFYRRPPLAVLQVVWPDRDGAFPWQPEAKHHGSQPQLWQAPEDHEQGVWTQDL